MINILVLPSLGNEVLVVFGGTIRSTTERDDRSISVLHGHVVMLGLTIAIPVVPIVYFAPCIASVLETNRMNDTYPARVDDGIIV